MTASTGNVPGRIFMSYRREDTGYPAAWLYDRLARHFRRSHVFKDIDSSIEPDDDFVDVITAAVGSCDVLLALIGNRWLTITGQDGQRRLDNADNFVRLELEAALTRNVRVIPVLVKGARMPRADELPTSLAKLGRQQAVELSSSRFDVDIQRLLSVLDRAITERQEQARQEAEEAAARQRQQVEQLQGQIRDRAAAQDWDAVVAASDELAALDPAAADPDALASAAREQITRRQEAERAAVGAQHRPGQKPGAPATRESRIQAPQLRRPKIFLCYRREDTQGFARGIYESLAGKYGHEQVFRDIDSTPAGVRFSTWIESRVGRCTVMVVLIGDVWLSAKDHTGQRRLDSPKDWVRLEIETALRRDIPIIPVLVQGAPMPSEDELPASISDLTGFQSAEITDSRWGFDMGLLIQAIDSLIPPD